MGVGVDTTTKIRRASMLLISLILFASSHLVQAGQSNNITPPPPPPTYKLTRAQIQSYRKNGYIIIPGLLQGQELDDAVRAANSLHSKKTLLERLTRRLFTSYGSLHFQTWRNSKGMEHVAFDSAAPSVCAQLMGLEKNSSSSSKSRSQPTPLRLLKDAFLAYGPDSTGCGWHVDDKYFWPCQDTFNRLKKDAGVNVWITLSPVSVTEGGGLAVAKGSHRQWWREKARAVITQNGFLTTCKMENLSPKYHQMLEKCMVVKDMKPGDAIIHDRYTFHRPVAFAPDYKSKNQVQSKLRISLRYMPASAKFEPHPAQTDSAILEKNMRAGDVLSKGGEYFPQVWPHSLPEEREAGVKDDKKALTWGSMAKLAWQGIVSKAEK